MSQRFYVLGACDHSVDSGRRPEHILPGVRAAFLFTLGPRSGGVLDKSRFRVNARLVLIHIDM